LDAARVWKLCAERKSIADAEALVGAASLPVLLEQLLAAELIAWPSSRRRVDESFRRSRRRALLTAAVAGAAVFTIVAPSVAEAASTCGPLGEACCTSPPLCLSGLRCGSGVCG